MIEIPGLRHFKAHEVLLPNILKLGLKRAARGPPRRGAPLLGVGRVALKPALPPPPYENNLIFINPRAVVL